MERRVPRRCAFLPHTASSVTVEVGMMFTQNVKADAKNPVRARSDKKTSQFEDALKFKQQIGKKNQGDKMPTRFHELWKRILVWWIREAWIIAKCPHIPQMKILTSNLARVSQNDLANDWHLQIRNTCILRKDTGKDRSSSRKAGPTRATNARDRFFLTHPPHKPPLCPHHPHLHLHLK